ncbi:MAG: lysophospholipid acyltransferase family protein [Myxococcota bacterium]
MSEVFDSMLDLARLDRLKLVRRPFSQRFLGWFLGVNYGRLPGIKLKIENQERIPNRPVIFAMNHTDRYNYWPLQYLLWQKLDRFTTTWVKGKYYEGRLMARFMESMLQLPTVSRGYLITRDFISVMKRAPTDREYALLRTAVDARAVGQPGELPIPPDVPEMLFRKARNPIGVAYAPNAIDHVDYADYICALFREMMGRFVGLNVHAMKIGLDLLVFPQGTRSKRLLAGRIGISQIALHLKVPIVPIGCNGSDGVYPGPSPFARRGRITYRIGEPIPYEELSAFHIREPFTPFSAEAERNHVEKFDGVTNLVTDRIEELLDVEYHRAESAEDAGDAPERKAEHHVADRFV